MAKFMVQISQFIQELAELVVEAPTADAAKSLVSEILLAGVHDLDWHDGNGQLAYPPEIIDADQMPDDTPLTEIDE